MIGLLDSNKRPIRIKLGLVKMRSGVAKKAVFLSLVWILAGCAQTQFFAQTAKRFGSTHKEGGGYKVGKPYKINGLWYYPQVDYEYQETGIASWYGTKFHGRQTANGEIYDMNTLTAAHRTLPMPSYVRVTNLQNGRSLILKVNDRGPFAHNRIIDVSRRGAQLLGFYRQGTTRVRVEILPNESRAIATRLTGGRQIARGQSPIKVAKLPKESVSTENLAPPPGGASVAPKPQYVVQKKLTQRVNHRSVERETPELGVVQTEPVQPTKLFVQAGAFSHFNNANRVRARLHRIGDVWISPVLVNGQDLYRVRLGPFQRTEQADRFLESVIRAGYSGARIVVE
jgi:rare lipoprotein A